jgi:cytochrome P450
VPALGNAVRLDDELVSPQAFADDSRIHAVFSELRGRAGLHWTEPEGFRPFWAVTRHADIMEASRANDVLISSRRLNLMSREQEAAAFAAAGKYGKVLRTLVHMDEPDHGEYRRATQAWFNGAAVRALRPMMEALAVEFVDKIAASGGTIDFARDIATWYPLRVVMSVLGVPQEDLPLMHRLTKTLAAPSDADFGGSSGTTLFDSIPEFTEYFLAMIADRRRNPRDDLASVIANGTVHGGPMGELETVSYCITMAVAGHDTTAASMAGGMRALAERPGQWDLLRHRPELLRTAADEMIRWVTPIRHFMRTAAADCTVGGQSVRAGESLALYYLSGNRDAAVFGEPFEFRVDRDPNRHLAFGFGAHLCLGMAIARMELVALFGELARRVEAVEPAGPARPIEANFLGGWKSLPIRCRLAA